MTIGRQQMVEIAKAISTHAKIVIMDEPTSSLSQHESEQLFQVIRQLRDQGVAIIYISHRLGEVRDLADRVTVLRDGENAGRLKQGEIEHDGMVKLMVGRDIDQFYSRKEHEIGEPLLTVNDLRTLSFPQHAINLEVRQGETVCLAGLVGAGRTEVLGALFGVDSKISGEISCRWRDPNNRQPSRCNRCRLGFGARRSEAAGTDYRDEHSPEHRRAGACTSPAGRRA